MVKPQYFKTNAGATRHNQLKKRMVKMNLEKAEQKFEVGQTIKAMDFAPSLNRKEIYVVGKIIESGICEHGFLAYTIIAERDTMPGKPRIGEKIFVPYVVDFMEFDERISLVEYQNYECKKCWANNGGCNARLIAPMKNQTRCPKTKKNDAEWIHLNEAYFEEICK